MVQFHSIQSDNPRPLTNYAEAFVVSRLGFAAGQSATDFATGIPPEARTTSATTVDDRHKNWLPNKMD